MKRVAVFIYAVFAYLTAIGIILYGIPFLANWDMPYTVDGGQALPFMEAFAINVGLLLVWGIQHTIMARPWFKRWLKGFSPAAFERSTYVLFSNIAFLLFYLFWAPMPDTIWKFEGVGSAIMTGLFWFGWSVAIMAILIKNHFHFLGLRQGYHYLIGKDTTPEPLVKSFIYTIVRHPMYFGFLLGYWATPHMTEGHLVFAAGMTVYTLIGIKFEEALLNQYTNGAYAEYQKKVPALIPFLRHG